MLTRVSVLVPRPSNVGIFLIDGKLYVFSVFLDQIRHLNAGQASTNGQNLELFRGRVLVAVLEHAS